MSSIDRDCLELVLRRRVNEMEQTAKLPKELPWAKGVEVLDLAKTGTHMDRFNDGKFSVTFGVLSFILDGGVRTDVCELRWKVTINTVTGTITAKPIFVGKVESKQKITDAHFLMLGFSPRVVGTVGPLDTLFPEGEGVAPLRARFGIPVYWGTKEDIALARAELARAFVATRVPS